MRQRTTFYHYNEDAIERSSLKIEMEGRSLAGPDIKAVREDKFTIGLEELPSELQQLLRDSHELHIRWSPAAVYDTMGPWSSRLPPGLHVFYTPQKDDGTADSGDPLCAFLSSAVNLKNCSESLEFFSRLPNDRFSHSTAYQAYLPMERLVGFPEYAAPHICSESGVECQRRVYALYNAKSFDLSYDTISHVLKVSVIWDHQIQALDMTGHPDHRVEVGLLTPDIPKSLEEHELGVTGLLTVLGEDTKPSQVQFAFPSRHKATGSSFSAEFLPPVGLHPTMQLQIGSIKPPMKDSFCSLHAYFTLPKTIFADKYQLEDLLFLESKNLTALRYISQPVDLEAPSYVMKLWGSSLLLELKPPAEETSDGFTVEVPLHLRYQAPREGGKQSSKVPYPAVFWACTTEEGTLFPNSPFDRVNLGYDGLFGPRTLFWHLDPAPRDGSSNLMLKTSVPVLDLDKASSVSMLTSVVVLAGFAWIVWKLLAVFMKSGHGAPPPQGQKEKKTQ